MIILGTQHLRVRVVVVDLKTLIFQILSQIFLRIFLVILEVVLEDEGEDLQTLEVQI